MQDDQAPEQAPQPQPGPAQESKGPLGPSRWTKLTSIFTQCRRVFKLTKKPTSYEFKTLLKVCAIGMEVLGLIGFVISVINQLLLF